MNRTCETCEWWGEYGYPDADAAPFEYPCVVRSAAEPPRKAPGQRCGEWTPRVGAGEEKPVAAPSGREGHRLAIRKGPRGAVLELDGLLLASTSYSLSGSVKEGVLLDVAVVVSEVVASEER